jgi:hypothetical protein
MSGTEHRIEIAVKFNYPGPSFLHGSGEKRTPGTHDLKGLLPRSAFNILYNLLAKQCTFVAWGKGGVNRHSYNRAAVAMGV